MTALSTALDHLMRGIVSLFFDGFVYARVLVNFRLSQAAVLVAYHLVPATPGLFRQSRWSQFWITRLPTATTLLYFCKSITSFCREKHPLTVLQSHGLETSHSGGRELQ